MRPDDRVILDLIALQVDDLIATIEAGPPSDKLKLLTYILEMARDEALSHRRGVRLVSPERRM